MLHPLLTDQEIKDALPGAERVTIFTASNHKSVGIKVGDMAQSIDITMQQTADQQLDRLQQTLLSLRMIHASNARQIDQARQAL